MLFGYKNLGTHKKGTKENLKKEPCGD